MMDLQSTTSASDAPTASPTPSGDEPREIERAIVIETDLPEESDRAFFTETGLRLRAKVQRMDGQVLRPVPNNVNAPVAPTSITYALSLAELDESNAIKTWRGELLIHDVHEVLVTAEQMAAPDWSLDDAIMHALRVEAAKIEKIAARREGDITAAEAAWGVS